MPQTHYEVLGVDQSSSLAEIKTAYRKIALTTHPDKNSGKEDQFKRALEAYNTLKDSKRRQEYDKSLKDLWEQYTPGRYHEPQTFSSSYVYQRGPMPTGDAPMPPHMSTPKSFFTAFDTYLNLRNIFNFRTSSHGTAAWSPFSNTMPGAGASTRPAPRDSRSRRRPADLFEESTFMDSDMPFFPEPATFYQQRKRQKPSASEPNSSQRGPSAQRYEQRRPASQPRSAFPRPSAGPNSAGQSRPTRPTFVDLSESEEEYCAPNNSNTQAQAGPSMPRATKRTATEAQRPMSRAKRRQFDLGEIRRDINGVELSDNEQLDSIGSTFGNFSMSNISAAETEMLQSCLKKTERLVQVQERLKLQTEQLKQALEQRQRGQRRAFDLRQTVEPLKASLQTQFDSLLEMQQAYRAFDDLEPPPRF